MEEEEFGGEPSSGESEVEPVKKKAYGRGPRGGPPKAKATKKATKANNKSTNDNDLDIQEKRLKESSVFEPTSAFRRKAGVKVSAEEKRLVGIDNEGSLSNEDAGKSAKTKKRRRPKAADWEAEYPNTTSEVPEDGGLDDEQLISIGMDNSYSIKTRWVKAPYVWNKKGILYQRYQRLVDMKDGEGKYRWSKEISKKYLGMDPDTWRSIRQNEGFFTAKGVPRRRKPKQLIPVRESNGKFKQAYDTQEGREISASTRYELIYNKIIEPGSTSMKRMRNARVRMEAVIEEALASNVASQKWGKEMATLWHEANKELLTFKDAAVRKIVELEDKIQKYETCDVSTQTELTQEGCDSPQHQAYIQQLYGMSTHTPTPRSLSSSSGTDQTRARSDSSNGLFISREPMPSTEMELMAGAPEAHSDDCPYARFGTAGECRGIIGRINLYDVENSPAISTPPRTITTDALQSTSISEPAKNLNSFDQNLNPIEGSHDDGVIATAGSPRMD